MYHLEWNKALVYLHPPKKKKKKNHFNYDNIINKVQYPKINMILTKHLSTYTKKEKRNHNPN